MKRILSSSILSVATLLTGCANVHEFINNPALTTAAPGLTNTIKTTFWPERYNTIDPEKTVPTDFANTIKDKVGDFVLLGFTGDVKNKATGEFSAYYYKPVPATGNITTVQMGQITRFPGKTKAGKTFKSAIFTTELNCAKQTVTYKSGKAFSETDFQGSVVSNTTFVGKEQVVLLVKEGDVQYGMWQNICTPH